MKKDEEPRENLEEYYSQKMDELLDKINKYGYENLTRKEKKLLKKASEFLEKKDKN